MIENGVKNQILKLLNAKKNVFKLEIKLEKK